MRMGTVDIPVHRERRRALPHYRTRVTLQIDGDATQPTGMVTGALRGDEAFQVLHLGQEYR